MVAADSITRGGHINIPSKPSFAKGRLIAALKRICYYALHLMMWGFLIPSFISQVWFASLFGSGELSNITPFLVVMGFR